MRQRLEAILKTRTQDGRKQASSAVELWQNAVERVANAIREGEFSYRLPSDLASGIDEAGEAARTANYVSAVGIAERASELRKAVRSQGLANLGNEVKRREEVVARLSSEICSVKEHRVSDLRSAQDAASTTVARAESHRKGCLSAIGAGLGSIGIGCGGAVVGWILVMAWFGIAAWLASGGNRGITAANEAFAGKAAGWITGVGVAYAVWCIGRAIWTNAAVVNAEVKSKGHYVRKEEQIEAEFSRCVSELDARLGQAEESLMRARVAFEKLK